jgi:hypothetical protein
MTVIRSPKFANMWNALPAERRLACLQRALDRLEEEEPYQPHLIESCEQDIDSVLAEINNK